MSILTPLPPEALRVERWNALLAAPPLVTLVMIGALAAVFVATSVAGGDVVTLGRWGAKVGPRIARGEAWRLVTASYLHGGLFHLLANAVALYVLGRQCENLFSRAGYFAVFVLTGVTAQTASWLGTPALSIGSSGPIFGLLGALISFHLRRRAEVPEMHRGVLVALATWAAWSIATGLLQPDLDNWAHGGGLAGGLLLGLLIPSPIAEGAAAHRRRFGVALAVPAAVLVLGAGTLLGASVARTAAWTRHRHLPAGFAVDYPSDWTLSAAPAGDAMVVSDDIGGAVCLGRTARTPGQMPALPEVLGACAGDVVRPTGDVTRPEILVRGHKIWRRVSWRARSGSVELTQRIDLTEAAGHTYYVVAESPTRSWRRYEPTFDAVLDSFTLP